jgi:Protein of unknown function (DUF2793)
MTDLSDRLKLPLLATWQAQKEMTHNEALALTDMLVQPVVEAVAPASVPASPGLGKCWIVGAGASGAWAGKDGHLACWTGGGWRFSAPFAGMSVWSVADAVTVRRSGSAWQIGAINAKSYAVNGAQVVGVQRPAIAGPTGGTVIDAQARITLTSILDALRAHGLIAN